MRAAAAWETRQFAGPQPNSGRADRPWAVPQPPVALYVHIPFCVSHCPYCDFVVLSGAPARGPRNRIGAFLDALAVELTLRAQVLDLRFGFARPPLESVYLGGGTPSLLSPDRIAALLELIDARFGLSPTAEITLEANPGPTEIGDLAGFRAAGVDRLSIGAQSMASGELRALGRRHTPADVRRAVAAARMAGFRRLSVDLLYDVPGQTTTSWNRTLGAVVGLEPDHVSAYALTLDDPDAEGLTGPLGDHLPLRSGARAWRRRARAAQDEERSAELYAMADDRLSAAGLRWYEISNWARPGQESRHNLVYWRHEPYEACGPGAHAFDGRTRRWNAARLDGYLSALAPADGSPARLPPGGWEPVDAATARSDAAILALRTRDGLSDAAVAAGGFEDAVTWGAARGLLERCADGVALTLRGRLLTDELSVRLLRDVRPPPTTAREAPSPALAVDDADPRTLTLARRDCYHPSRSVSTHHR